MTPVEQLLSDTADYLQHRLEEDRALEVTVAALLEQGQSPAIVRPMRDPPASEVCIVLRAAPMGT